MTRLIHVLIPVVFVVFACVSTPTTPTAEPATSTSPASTASADCPSPSDPCMNEENYAACLAVAEKCPGEVLQLESCPLQFACNK